MCTTTNILDRGRGRAEQRGEGAGVAAAVLVWLRVKKMGERIQNPGRRSSLRCYDKATSGDLDVSLQLQRR